MSSRWRLRKARSNWPMGNALEKWEPPPIQLNELVQPKEPVVLEEEEAPYEGGPLNMHGFMYHPKTKKYFKMTADPSLPSGFSKADIDRNNRARQAKFQANRQRASGSFSKRPVFKPVHTLFEDLNMGNCTTTRMERHIHESRLLSCTPSPSFTINTPIDHYNVLGCEYLDVSADGDRIVGTFTVQEPGTNSKHSAIYVFEVDSIADTIQSETQRREDYELTPINNRPKVKGFNTLGMTVRAMPNDDDLADEPAVLDYAVNRFNGSFIVDQTIAKIDQDVCCMLTVTATDTFLPSGIVTSSCSVHLEPLSEFSDPEAQHIIEAPLYNRLWKRPENIWSVGWNGPKMSIGIGMEDCFRFENLLTDRHFLMSSRKRNVLAHCFSTDGNLVFMGLRNDNVIKSDLRMNRDHITGYLNGAQSATYLKVFESRPECVLTEGFDSIIRLWDFRWPKRPFMKIHGHRNDSNRLNVVMDKDERFVFAAGSDRYVRGWSLTTGDMLCSIPPPDPNDPIFPRVAYSDIWGNRPGNTALMIAVGDSMRVHVLEL